MSLTKMSTRRLENGIEACGVRMHDLHLAFCRNLATRIGSSALWHRRLLHGHLAIDTCASTYESDSLGMAMLEYTPRSWREDDIPNVEYIRRNLCGHVLSAGLNVEVGAIVLNLRWISAQAHTGDMLGLKKNFGHLELARTENGKGDDNLRTCIRSIRKALEFSSASFEKGPRVVSFTLLSHLFVLSKTSEFLERFLQFVKASTPKPYLVPTMCFYHAPEDGLAAAIDLNRTDQENVVFSCLKVSKCEQYLAAGVGNDISVSNLDTGEQLQYLKGHHDIVVTVKFNSNASRIISGSHDGNVIVWDWKAKEALSASQDHSSPVTGLSFSCNDSKLCSFSREGYMRVRSIHTGLDIQSVALESGICCISFCPNGRLRGYWSTGWDAQSHQLGVRKNCFRNINEGQGVSYVNQVQFLWLLPCDGQLKSFCNMAQKKLVKRW